MTEKKKKGEISWRDRITICLCYGIYLLDGHLTSEKGQCLGGFKEESEKEEVQAFGNFAKGAISISSTKAYFGKGPNHTPTHGLPWVIKMALLRLGDD